VTVGVTRIGSHRLTNRKSAHARLAKAVNSSLSSRVGKTKKNWLEKFCHSHRNQEKGAHFFAIRESHSKMTEVNIPPTLQYQVALC